ncbi:MAG: hypothetical protein NE334_06270 [Lentisphaeraceae bacterium]|nr:hypothetical protein [Lentisphaeraceae bacterium]
MKYQIKYGDELIVTTKNEIVHEAKLIEVCDYGLYIEIQNFGKLSVKWSEILTIHQSTLANISIGGFTPRYKVLIWRNSDSQEAS